MRTGVKTFAYSFLRTIHWHQFIFERSLSETVTMLKACWACRLPVFWRFRKKQLLVQIAHCVANLKRTLDMLNVSILRIEWLPLNRKGLWSIFVLLVSYWSFLPAKSSGTLSPYIGESSSNSLRLNFRRRPIPWYTLCFQSRNYGRTPFIEIPVSVRRQVFRERIDGRLQNATSFPI